MKECSFKPKINQSNSRIRSVIFSVKNEEEQLNCLGSANSCQGFDRSGSTSPTKGYVSAMNRYLSGEK